MGFLDFFKRKKKQPRYPVFLPEWQVTLQEKIQFYRSLSNEEKARFEKAVLRFLNTTEIRGIKTIVSKEDVVLIGASAIIPIFAFKDWEYINLHEVLIYPEHFDFVPEPGSSPVPAFGMVGFGYMEGKMILSKKALHYGFNNEEDKRNTAIHEFVHLIDKLDGEVDGILTVLKEKSYVMPWLELMDKKMEEIIDSKSDIRPYGATNRGEFMAVVSEYFFERPYLLQEKHPEVFKYMELMFRSKLTDRKMVERSKPTRRFDPCPCGSGKKFGDCCMKLGL
jgi:Mlc titration factor MtfA (ptsG expression regulator)